MSSSRSVLLLLLISTCAYAFAPIFGAKKKEKLAAQSVIIIIIILMTRGLTNPFIWIERGDFICKPKIG
jgi:hypothetical protein